MRFRFALCVGGLAFCGACSPPEQPEAIRPAVHDLLAPPPSTEPDIDVDQPDAGESVAPPAGPAAEGPTQQPPPAPDEIDQALSALQAATGRRPLVADCTGRRGAPSIQTAIDNAQPGDIIAVLPSSECQGGAYFENLRIPAKSITVQSLHPENPRQIAATVVHGGRRDSTIVFEPGVPPSTSLVGLTITGGLAANGGGILAMDSSPTVRSCIIRGNAASDSGGGVACAQGQSQWINCLIQDNQAGRGGGVSGVFTGAAFDNCIVINNAGKGHGGGFFFNHGSPRISNTVVTRNQATHGAAICAQNSSGLQVINCTVSANHAVASGGGLWFVDAPEAVIANSIVWANTARIGPQLFLSGVETVASVSYSVIEGGPQDVYAGEGATYLWGPGATDEDPQLDDDQIHVLPSSPCVDAGDHTLPQFIVLDIDGDARISATGIDIGADELQFGPPATQVVSGS